MSSVLRFDEWQDSEGNTVYDGATGGLIAPGLVAVKSALFTGTQTASVNAGDNVAVTDLSITHEVSDPANRLIISAFLGAAGNSEGFGNTGLAVHDGTELIAVSDSAGSRVATTVSSFPSGTRGGQVIASPSATFVVTPGSGSKTYTVRAVNIRNETHTLYINRAEIDTDGANRSRAVSSIVIQEVAV